jgi:hypothetical protein
MQRRMSVVAIVVAVVAVAVVGSLAIRNRTAAAPQGGAAEAAAEADGGEEGRGGAAELQEEAELAQERLEAWREAKAAGTLRVNTAAPAAPAPGWAGEQVISPTADDWEPAIAADPNAPYVYLLATRYTGSTACGNQCPLPYHVLKVSTDGGATWGPDRYLCECRRVQGQFDPIIEVVPGTGAVYAAWMNDYNVVFSKSTDHGATWSTPVKTYGKVSWNDKPVLAVSDNGQDVYVAWNGPNNGDPWIAQSHDAGATWTQSKIVNGTRYYFAFDGDVLPNGTVVFGEGSLDYSGPGGAAVGQVFQHVLRSTNGGASWTDTVVDQVELGEPCEADGCYADFYDGHNAITADTNGQLTLLYDGATTIEGPATIWARRSTNGGATWSARVAISAAGEHATAPAAEARGPGDVRAWYYQTTGGNADAWKVWYRSSTDGGLTWSTPVKISDAPAGAAKYIGANGFKEIYGDYGEAAITSAGKFIGIWGEGDSYTGPGGVWFNRQT